MVFLCAQSLFAILHSRLDDILPAECVTIYLRIIYFFFPCKCFPWICLEMPRKVWLFCTSLMLLMMYALLIAEKDWWPQIAPFQTYLHLQFYPKRSFTIRGSINCQKYLHLYYKLKRRTPRTFCIKSHPDLVLKDQYKIIFQFNSNLDLRPNLNDGTIGFWFWDFIVKKRMALASDRPTLGKWKWKFPQLAEINDSGRTCATLLLEYFRYWFYNVNRRWLIGSSWGRWNFATIEVKCSLSLRMETCFERWWWEIVNWVVSEAERSD